MSDSAFVLPQSELPSWVQYPLSFRRIVDQGLVRITPWHILTGEQALVHSQGLAQRYPARALFPFARRQDNDDVACWSKGNGEKVFVIHDFAAAGWEDEALFDDVWSWFRSAIEETIE